MKRLNGILFAAIAACLPITAAASTSAAVSAEAVATFDAFRTTANRIKSNLTGDGRYSHLPRGDRNLIQRELGQIETLLSKHGTFEAMSADDQVTLMNAQESVNTLLESSRAQVDDRVAGDRMVCTMEQSLGSRMRERKCRKASDIARERELARDALRNAQSNPLQSRQ